MIYIIHQVSELPATEISIVLHKMMYFSRCGDTTVSLQSACTATGTLPHNLRFFITLASVQPRQELLEELRQATYKLSCWFRGSNLNPNLAIRGVLCKPKLYFKVLHNVRVGLVVHVLIVMKFLLGCRCGMDKSE